MGNSILFGEILYQATFLSTKSLHGQKWVLFLMKKQLIWRRPLCNMTKSASPQVQMAGVDGLGHEIRQSSFVTFDRFLAVWENTGVRWCVPYQT